MIGGKLAGVAMTGSASLRGAPRLSVVMPVRNAGPYLDAAVASILGQSFTDFEFIIRDDGSTDGSTEVLRTWAACDGRIRLFESADALGPAGSSNWIVGKASAPIVARMDADDRVHPHRLQLQWNALHQDPTAVLVGTLARCVDANGRPVRPRDRWRLARRSPFAPFPHGSIMFRQAAFERVGGYRRECDFWEDLDLFLRLSRVGRILVLPDALYEYRLTAGSVRLTSERDRVEDAVDLMYRCVEEFQRSGCYERVLAGRNIVATRKLRPETFAALGANMLWTGSRPGTWLRVLRRAELDWTLASLVALVWAVWSQISPSTLRSCLKTLVQARDWVVRRRFVDGRSYEWQPGSVPYQPARRLALLRVDLGEAAAP